MRKRSAVFLSVLFALLLFLVFSTSVLAFSAKEVLGDSTVQVSLSIPPTAEGPGFILPDSPLFFLDKLKQEVRLFLAFTPEEKAKIHAAVAGERLAELQFMLAKNNVSGIRTALQGVADNLKKASDDLDSAKLSGRNINLLAKSINDSIKDKQQKLSVLEAKATGEIKAQVQATKEALKISKIKVEDNLPQDLLINEVVDDLNQEIDDNLNKATSSAKGINRAIEVLTRLASEAAQKNQIRREEALRQAIEVKNVISTFEKASISLQKEGQPATTAATKTAKTNAAGANSKAK